MANTRLSLLAAAMLCCVTAGAQSLADYPLLPVPQAIEFKGGKTTVRSAAIEMPCRAGDWKKSIAALGADTLASSRYKITGEIADAIPGAPAGNDEAYSLSIRKNGITVKATSPKGIYWALMTLEQLAAESGRKGLSLPVCEIVDWPAFPYRGFMNDVGRSYISMEELKREINVMSRFKLNVFHWHLTENQAWRLESKIFPMLNDSSVTERQPGLYYTQAQARELVDYAKAHNVLLIPELDMPGHSAAFVRTFRHDMQSPEGMKILKLLVEEACEVFDVPYLHIGTDEVPFTNPDFVPEMVAFVRSKGKKAVSHHPGWNYGPGEIDLTTMWSYRGKPTPGVPAVDMKFHYINHFDVYADLIALYRSKVYGKTQADDQIKGVQIALWNDRFVDNEESNIIQNSLYTSMMVLAERAWHGGGTEYFDSLGTNMGAPDSQDFADFADFERRMLWHKDNTIDSITIPYVKQTNVHWRITDAFPNGGNLSTAFPPETEGLKQSYTYNDSVYNTTPATGAGIYLRHVWGSTVPTFYKNPQPNHTAYAYTWVYSPKDQTVGLQAETQNYSRSESDIAAPQGKWDYRDSKFWVNDKEIAPPVWTATHKVRSNEIPMGNENFTARPPIMVDLHKGWNKVLIKLPIGEFHSHETRLVKWMYTFVFTTPDGRHAAPGLIYSPDKVK